MIVEACFSLIVDGLVSPDVADARMFTLARYKGVRIGACCKKGSKLCGLLIPGRFVAIRLVRWGCRQKDALLPFPGRMPSWPPLALPGAGCFGPRDKGLVKAYDPLRERPHERLHGFMTPLVIWKCLTPWSVKPTQHPRP